MLMVIPQQFGEQSIASRGNVRACLELSVLNTARAGKQRRGKQRRGEERRGGERIQISLKPAKESIYSTWRRIHVSRKICLL